MVRLFVKKGVKKFAAALLAATLMMGSTALAQSDNRDTYADVTTCSVYGVVGVDFDISYNSKDVLSNFKVEIDGFVTYTDNFGYFFFDCINKSEAAKITISKAGYLTRTFYVELLSDVMIGNEEKPVEMWAGDIPVNGKQDGLININDYTEVSQYFGKTQKDAGYKSYCDFNQDGAINMEDVMMIAKHFNATSQKYPDVEYIMCEKFVQHNGTSAWVRDVFCDTSIATIYVDIITPDWVELGEEYTFKTAKLYVKGEDEWVIPIKQTSIAKVENLGYNGWIMALEADVYNNLYAVGHELVLELTDFGFYHDGVFVEISDGLWVSEFDLNITEVSTIYQPNMNITLDIYDEQSNFIKNETAVLKNVWVSPMSIRIEFDCSGFELDGVIKEPTIKVRDIYSLVGSPINLSSVIKAFYRGDDKFVVTYVLDGYTYFDEIGSIFVDNYDVLNNCFWY